MSKYRKAIVAVVGAALMVASSLIPPGPAGDIVQVLIGLATAAGVYRVPNEMDQRTWGTGRPVRKP